MLRALQNFQVRSTKGGFSGSSSQSVLKGILTRANICNSVRTYSQNTKHDGKISSIKDSPPKNLMDEISESQEGRKDISKNRRWLVLGILFTAFTLGTIWFVGPTTPKKVEVDYKKKRRPVLKVPLTSDEIPKDVPYLLIGGGTAAFTAFRAIKSADPTAKVLIISNENFYPYMRPPLSKEIWFNDDEQSVKRHIFKQWNGSERSLFYEPDDFYINCSELMKAPNGGVAVARGWNVKKLDVTDKNIILDDDSVVHFDKCLIATGAKPKLSTVFEAAIFDEKVRDLVKVYRNIYDFEEVHEMFGAASDIAIIGGGFLGSELACAMARKDKEHKKNIYQIFKEPGNMAKILPEYLTFWTTDKVKNEGVKVLKQTEVMKVESQENKLLLTLNNGKTLLVDYVVLAVGAIPNTELAEDSGLEVDSELGGYLVNTELQARTDVYVAGDCACFYDIKLGRRRFEHHDHAVVTGRLAGENMTGARKAYVHQSMFWSDLGPDVGYEAIGIVDSSLPTIAVFAKVTEKDVAKSVTLAAKEDLKSKTEQNPPEAKAKESALEGRASMEAANKVISRPKPSDEEDFGKGVIFYLKDGIVVGIVLWNVFNRMSVARQVLLDHKKYDDLNEVAKLFTIHEE